MMFHFTINLEFNTNSHKLKELKLSARNSAKKSLELFTIFFYK